MSKKRAVKLHIKPKKQDEILLLGPGNEPVLLVQWDGQEARGVEPPADEHSDESKVDSLTDDKLNTEPTEEGKVEVTTTGTPAGPEPKDESREPKKDAPKVDRDISGEPDIPDAQDVVEDATEKAKGVNPIKPEVKSETAEKETDSKTDDDDPSLADLKEEESPDSKPAEPKQSTKSGTAADLVEEGEKHSKPKSNDASSKDFNKSDDEEEKEEGGKKGKKKKPKKDGMN